ncbi:hypothetical protein AB0H76_13050 [Nocardia sp. NPDC050712]|uniref:hypothetical protein n=1 Tax=Nocardia sp. NPDC050712 TaxID=3155518 RepID=UPI0033F8E82D
MDSVRQFVSEAVDRSLALTDGTAVIDAGSGRYVQWLASAERIYSVEAGVPTPRTSRSLRQRLRGQQPDPLLVDTQIAALVGAGFTAGRSNYELRDAVYVRDQAVEVVVSVLRDAFAIGDAATLSVEIF